MDYVKPSMKEVKACMRDPDCIRNVCILAHVDHGKTTVADLLLATNRLISKRSAGSLRYLDDRRDEQERGITMKCSAVSLLNIMEDENGELRKILLNLIDTPGHIDFSSEVDAAIRVCDGALIVVDVAEGVCAQTREAIRKAYEEHAKMILVINKLDRLIMELFQDVESIFQTVAKVIEDCNVVIAEVYQYGFTNYEIDIEDTGLLFSPDTGNVIFASASDGWAFTTKKLCQMMLPFVRSETIDTFNKKMWNFDCWIDSKGCIRTGAIFKEKPNLFTQLCLKTILHVYESLAIRMDRSQTETILQRLGITFPSREMLTANDPRAQVKAILSTWSPMAQVILLQCLSVVPPPNHIKSSKIGYLLNANKYIEDPFLHGIVEKMAPHFANINSGPPMVAYLSKMFCVNKLQLSRTAINPIVPARKPRAAAQESPSDTDNISKKEIDSQAQQAPTPEDEIKKMEEENAIIGLTRVFAGTLKVGQELYVILNGYLPSESDPTGNENNRFVKKVEIRKLYILFGRDMVEADQIPAGNFCGVEGLEAAVIRTATLSTDLDVIPLVENPPMPPVVRHAIEPADPKQLPVLRHALRLLMQSDSCVQVMMQETGELVLLTAGDVHLEKCLEDLRNKFAKILFNVSSPMVSLRETIINKISENIQEDEFSSDYSVFTLKVVHLPQRIIDVIKSNLQLIKTVEEYEHCSLIDLIKRFKATDGGGIRQLKPKMFKSDVTNRAIAYLRDHLKSTFETCGCEEASEWTALADKIWSVGKIEGCANVLINNTEDYFQNIFLETNVNDKRTLIAQCLLNAFQSFLKAGPICSEPITHCAFIISKFQLVRDINLEEITPQMSSAEEAAATNAFMSAFQCREQRLMEPMFRTSVIANPNILGKVYSVVSRRHGNVLEAVGMDEKEKSFLVEAEIPVLDSDGFANEVRKATSGLANPNLRFGDYKVIDGDPFVPPVQDEEESSGEFGIKFELSLRAIHLRRDVRRRKGLHVDDEVVVHAEKQRTLNKKK